MAAKERRWSDLTMRVRLKWWKSYTFNMNAVFATYAYELDDNGRPYVGTHTEWGKGRFGRFQGMSQNISFTLSPEQLKKWFGGGSDKNEDNKKKKTNDDEGVDTDIESNVDDSMINGQRGAKKRDEAGKRGPITYVENVLKEGLKYKPETYEIRDESGTTRLKAFLISCANASQYGNNAYIAPQASMSDGLMDIIVMQPFDAFEAPQISIDMFNKTLDKNSKIKTFRCKHLHIHRNKPGYIHYDGDPVMTGEDIEVELKEKGINIIVNPHGDKRLRRPNAIQNAAADLFNEFNSLRKDINRQSRHILAINKKIQRRLNL